MTTTEYVRVAIIGCGLIGAEWDRASPANKFALTHARAFSQHPRARLVALCDRDEELARRTANYWHVAHSYTEPKQLFAEQNIDVVVIATPSAVRWTVIEPAVTAGVKVVVIEKPLARTLEECMRLVAVMDAKGVRSVVNYSRNWDPSMRELKGRISAGEMGRMQRVVATYGKGLGNNGSHLIDLTGFLCSARPLRVRALGSPLDASEAAWSPVGERAWDAQVEFIDAKGSIINLTLLGTDQSAFTCFELRLIGRKAMLDMSMGGRCLKWIELRDDPNFAGYVIPATDVALPVRYLEAMQEMADEAVRLAIDESITSSCDAHTAMGTALVVEGIQRSAQNDGQWITLDTMKESLG